MIIECITIVSIIVMISFIFLRTKRRRYAIVTFPLITIPLLHIVGQAIAYFFFKGDNTAEHITVLSFDLLGILLGALFMGMLIGNIHSKKARLSFVIISAFFMIALAIVLMTDLLIH